MGRSHGENLGPLRFPELSANNTCGHDGVSFASREYTTSLAVHGYLSAWPLPRIKHQGPQLTIQTGTNGLAVLVDEDAGIVVEAHDAAVGALQLLGRPHHDGVPYVAAAHLVGRAHRHAAAAGLGPEAALLLHNDDDAFAWEGGLARGCLVGRLLEFVEPGGAFEVCAVLAGMTGSSKLCFKDFKSCM